MVRKKKAQEYEEKIQQALAVLSLVSEDSTTPRNIRRAAKDAIDALQSPEFTAAVRASNAISRLDEILQDPNMPPYTRVKLWNVMSLIEAIKEQFFKDHTYFNEVELYLTKLKISRQRFGTSIIYDASKYPYDPRRLF